MADVTEQTPLAAPEQRPKSIKRLVVTSAAISLALGLAAVTAVDHGLMSFSSEPYVQIKLSGTDFCLGVLDRKNADSKSKLIIYQCDSKMKGQAFQMVPVGGGYNIKYNTYKGGNEDVDRTLCVNNPSSGGTLQLYQCKSGDPNSLWYYKNGKLVSDKDDDCMATQIPAGQSSLSNSDYVDAMRCGEEYTKWNVPTPRPTPRPRPTPHPTPHPTPRPTPRPTDRPQSSFSPGCNDLCYYDSDCRTSCSKCLSAGDGSSRKTCQKPSGPQCNEFCERNSDCPNSCPICLRKPGVMQQCVPEDDDNDDEIAQCDRQCSGNYDCSTDGGKWSTGQPWCGECKNGWCEPNKQSCNYDYDCPRDKAVCGPNGYCVGK